MVDRNPTVLFITNTFKGTPMIQQVKALGCFVLLITEDKQRDEAWNRNDIDEIFFTPDFTKYQDVINTITYLNRGRHIDYIVPLDEFEMELAGILREHLRLGGLTTSQIRPFRDKLAMRETAHHAGILVPPFIGIKNYDDLRAYMADVPPPWVLKPRTEAGSMGIQKVKDAEQVWRALDQLGDRQSYYLLEQFIPGDVFHVDTLYQKGKPIFSSVQQYGAPPMSVYQGGGVFMSRIIERKKGDAPKLRKINADVNKALGMVNGVTHTEFIKAHHDQSFYFLESAARVGGANIAEMIESATNVNLWREWGRMIVAELRQEPYVLPELKELYGGVLMTLARQEHPDLSAYNAKEVVWKADKSYHAGLIVAGDNLTQVETLLSEYMAGFIQDFSASAPPMGVQRTGLVG